MAEELVTYDPDGPGDPDPLGLEKKLVQLKSKSDPLGLEAKLRSVQKTSEAPKQPAFQVQIQEPAFGRKIEAMVPTGETRISESGITAPKEFSFDKPYDPLAVEKLRGKAQEAQKRLHSELQGNDEQYIKNLKEIRRDSYTVENLRQEYKNKGMILPPQDEQRLLKIEKDRRYNAPVTPEDVSDIKAGTILDNINAKKFIKRIDNAELNASAWLVKKYNEVANDPNGNHRVEKIKNVATLIKKGAVKYDPETEVAVQPLGLVGSLIEGVSNKYKADEEHDFLKNTTNDAAIISQLEDERNNPDTDEPIKVPRGRVAGFIKSIAETPLMPIVAGTAGTIGGTFIGNPEIGTVAATALGAYENRKAQYRSTFKQVYNELRDQGKSEFDALATARRQAENAQEIGTIVGAAQGLTGAKIGAIPIKGTSFGIGFQKSIGQFLKNNGSEFGKIALDAVAQGGLGVAGEVTKNKLAQAAGIKRDWDEGTADVFWGNVFMAAGIGAALKLGRGISSINYKNILHGMTKNVPEEAINVALQEKVAAGEVTQDAATQAMNVIKDYKAKDAQIPANVTEEARFKIQDNIDKITELEQQKEATHKSLQGPIQERIDKLIDENLALSKETVKPEKSVSGLSKDKEKEAIDFAHELVDEGVLPDTYAPEVKKDPIKFWQTIAQQAQNRDENWKPLSQSLDEQAVRDNYGDTIVDYAKELFPAPEKQAPSKLVSVIQPEEIKRPEIKTISPDEQIGHVEVSEHGQDTKTAAGKENGIGPSPLTEAGLKEAKDLGQYIADKNKSKIITSEVERGLQTAEEAAKEAKRITGNDVPIERNELLNTANIGSDEGKPEGTFKEKEWFEGKYLPDGAESPSAFKTRMEKAYEYVKSLPEDTHVVSHSKVMRALDALSKTDGKWTDETTDIFLKNKELPHAIQERSATTPIVDEAPGSGQKMGAGISEPGETAIPQEGQRPTQEERKITGEEGQVSEPEMIGITHAQMDKVSRELGLPEYSKDPESFESWIREAKDRLAKNPNAINELINKLRNGDMPDPVETQMMKMHFAALKGKYGANPTPELRAEIARVKDLYNISGRMEAKSLSARRGLMPVDENTLFDFHQRDVEFNKGAPLTEKQTSQSTKEFNEIKAARDAYEAKLKIAEEENAKLKAQKKLQQEAKIAKKDTTKDYKKERSQILKDIGDKWKKSSKESLGASILPYAKELAAIAPDVLKLVKNLVQEGLTELPKVVKTVHSQLKDIIPSITEKDIHDIIAGEYSEKKPPRSKLATQLHDLRVQAKLINELHGLLSGEAPKSERKVRQKNQKIEALRKQINELKDEAGLNDKTDAQKLDSLKGRYKTKIKEIEDKIAKGDYGPDEKPEPIKLDKEAQDLRDELLRLKDERAIRLLKQQYADRTTGEKVVSGLGKALRTGRQLQSGFFDVSYPFRQTIVGVSRQLLALPFKREGGKLVYSGFENQRKLRQQFGEMYRAFGSEKGYRRTMADIKESPRFDVAQESKLDIAEIDTPLERFKEEEAQQSYAEKIPVAKQAVRMSNRAATVIANKMKFDIFNQLVDGFEQSGKTFENSPELYKEAAIYANKLVGRGFLGEKLEMASPLIGHFIYSLRLQASRLQLLTSLLNPKFYTKVPKEIRIEYLKDMTKFVLMGSAMLGLAKAAGLDVETDPRSSDFGSIKWGETRYDIWGGFKQYVTLFSRLLTASTKSPETGQISSLKIPFSSGKPGRGEKTYGDLLLRFGRTKASPEAGTLTDILAGETFDKRGVTARGEIVSYIAPMIIGDVYDAWKDNGVIGAALTYILSTHGVGTQSHIKEDSFDDIISGDDASSPSSKSPSKSKHTRSSKKIKRI